MPVVKNNEVPFSGRKNRKDRVKEPLKKRERNGKELRKNGSSCSRQSVVY